VTYTVSLKEEYQDDKFYPANGPTYLADNQYKDQFGFAVPSVKVPQKLTLKQKKSGTMRIISGERVKK
jgi:hypothetical protein